MCRFTSADFQGKDVASVKVNDGSLGALISQGERWQVTDHYVFQRDSYNKCKSTFFWHGLEFPLEQKINLYSIDVLSKIEYDILIEDKKLQSSVQEIICRHKQ